MDEHPQPPADQPPPPAPPAASQAGDGGRRAPIGLLTMGWRTAIAWAFLSVLLVGVLAEGVFFLGYFATSASQRPSSILLARLGGAVFYSFHHVAMVVDLAGLQLPAPFSGSAASVRFTLAVALMTGTVLVIALLYAAGRAIGRELAGPTWLRGLHGTKVALAYSVITFGASYGVRFRAPRLPAPVGGSLIVHPSHLAALLWPLALGVIFGFIGGFRSPGGAGWDTSVWDRRIRGALHGGWRMIVYGLLFGFLSLLGMAAVHPDITADYFNGAFHGSLLRGLTIVYAHSLFIPNMAAWVLFPSMGTCLGVNGGPISICALSYTHFPSSRVVSAPGGLSGLPFSLPSLPGPPLVYFGFVAVPLLAVLLGGLAAAKRAHPASREEAAMVGAMAGVAFALFALGTLLLASIRFKVGGSVGAVNQLVGTRVGPDVVSGTLLALLWGVVGGALGGLLSARSLGRRGGPVGPAWQSSVAQPPPDAPPQPAPPPPAAPAPPAES